jgi:hypothetical protein
MACKLSRSFLRIDKVVEAVLSDAEPEILLIPELQPRLQNAFEIGVARRDLTSRRYRTPWTDTRTR